jgi:hypothetical protein
MLSYTWYKEYYCKVFKQGFISAFEDVSNLTVCKVNRDSLNYDVPSLPVTVINCYTNAQNM